MSTRFSKKEIRNNLETALISEIEKMETSEPSKKIKRAVRKISKGIAVKVQRDMKKHKRRKTKDTVKQGQSDLNGFLIETNVEKFQPDMTN